MLLIHAESIYGLRKKVNAMPEYIWTRKIVKSMPAMYAQGIYRPKETVYAVTEYIWSQKSAQAPKDFSVSVAFTTDKVPLDVQEPTERQRSPPVKHLLRMLSWCWRSVLAVAQFTPSSGLFGKLLIVFDGGKRLILMIG